MAVRLNPLPAGVFDQEILDFPSSRADIAGMANKALTIQKLRRLAAGTGNEAETARIVLAQLEKAHPGAAAEADASTFRGRVNRARRAVGKTQEQVAKESGLTSGATLLERLKSPKIDRDLEWLQRLAKSLNVSPEWLAFGSKTDLSRG
jgi:ribosome-binding protein aMBF1 (putative translation factor)